MKKLTLSIVLIGTISSCGLSFGNYDAYQRKYNSNGPGSMCPTSNVEMTQDEFYSSLDCENCDEND